MQLPNNQVRSEWEQRDTEENSVASQILQTLPSQNQVDIVVAGVGGGGMNAIGHMISARVRGVRFVAMNTDAQVLALSHASKAICLGQNHTKGLGAGGNAAVGMRAATESTAEIQAALGKADLVFIAAGMGGGTGTGAAPVVASIAKKMGALTIGIVTLPFSFEGTRRRRIAEQGLHELSAAVDALITVPNDRLLSTVAREQSLEEAFKVADDVLRQGVQGIAEVINVPGMINVDFADVRSVLRDAGTALMSIGQGKGRNRAQLAAEEAIAGGFLNVTIRGAKRVLFNISGGEDMTLFEVNEVAERIGSAIDDAADITFGAVVDPALTDSLRVTLIAAGMEELHTTQLHAVRLEKSLSSMRNARNNGTEKGSAPGQPSPYNEAVRPTTATPMPALPPRHAPQHNTHLPARQAPSTPPLAPAGAPPPMPPPTRLPPSTSSRTQSGGNRERPQRSLNDLRGIRRLGNRLVPPDGTRKSSMDDRDDDNAIDIPPFLKR